MTHVLVNSIGGSYAISADLETVGASAWRNRLCLSDSDIKALYHHGTTPHIRRWQAKQAVADSQLQAIRQAQRKGREAQWAK